MNAEPVRPRAAAEPGEPPRVRVAAVFTGGTISMRADVVSGGAVPALSGAEILARVGDLGRLASVDVHDFGRFPGPHMTLARMQELCRCLASLLKDPGIAGIVVTHGTDTLEETAYLADLTLETERPVVFVGAMRHSSSPGWDGPANLRDAIAVAASAVCRELGVLVCLNGVILAAREAVKTHTEALDAFSAPESGPVGVVEGGNVRILRRPPRRRRFQTAALEERVEYIALPAGAGGGGIEHAVAAGARGLVLEALGCGNVPIGAVQAAEQALRIPLPVVIASRCFRGPVSPAYAYEGGGRRLADLGAISAGDLTAAKARIRLMVLLGAGISAEQARAVFPD